MKRKYLILVILLIIPTIYAENYGVEEYSCGLYGQGCSAASSRVSASSSGTSSSGDKSKEEVIEVECTNDLDCEAEQYCFENKCYDAECFSNSDCKKDEACWNYRCIKWFDMEILEFESPVKVGDFFNFTCFLKAVAEINGDVEIKFWIEQEGQIVTSGQDTIYFSSFEEKTKTKKLFLPGEISSGTYEFYIQVVYGAYTANAHRTIGIVVDDDLAEIKTAPKIENINQFIIYSLFGMFILILFLIFYFERKKIKAGLINEGKWIKKHRILILVSLLFIILGILVYYLEGFDLIAEWISKLVLWLKFYF